MNTLSAQNSLLMITDILESFIQEFKTTIE